MKLLFTATFCFLKQCRKLRQSFLNSDSFLPPLLVGLTRCHGSTPTAADLFNGYTGFLFLNSSHYLAFCKSLLHVLKFKVNNWGSLITLTSVAEHWGSLHSMFRFEKLPLASSLLSLRITNSHLDRLFEGYNQSVPSLFCCRTPAAQQSRSL
jgi:hypothetical protein